MIPKNNQQLEDQKKKFIKTYSECKLPISPLHYIIKKKKTRMFNLIFSNVLFQSK